MNQFFGFVTGQKGDIGGTYEFAQAIPASVWNINHNLNYFPNVTVVDSAGDQVIGQVEYVDRNNLKLIFGGAFAGNAYMS